MGLLDRWTKKKESEQLTEQSEKTEKKTTAKSAAEVESTPKKAGTKKAAATKEVKEKKATKKEEKKEEVSISGSKGKMYHVIIRPLVTEKAAGMEGAGKYSFLVSAKANKFQIAQAVNELYGVKPISVNVTHMPGKVVRFGRSMGRRSDYKKAIVTLEKGKTITLHENV
jgi:large subunit ribosomal protein L23